MRPRDIYLFGVQGELPGAPSLLYLYIFMTAKIDAAPFVLSACIGGAMKHTSMMTRHASFGRTSSDEL